MAILGLLACGILIYVSLLFVCAIDTNLSLAAYLHIVKTRFFLTESTLERIFIECVMLFFMGTLGHYLCQAMHDKGMARLINFATALGIITIIARYAKDILQIITE